jgi:hypothetical protein
MNATRLIPHLRRPLEAGPAYADALAEARNAVTSTCDRLLNCNSSRLPGRAVGSLCDLQRAADQLRLLAGPRSGRAHTQLIDALDELQDDVAELARRGGPSESLLQSRGLARTERALSRLAE